MKKKVLVIAILIIIAIVTLTKETFGDTTTRGVLVLNDNATTMSIANDDIVIKHTISSITKKDLTFKVEIENLQNVGTEVALVLDNSFSMWSNDKIAIYKQKMIDTVKKIYTTIPDAYMSLSGYNGTILEMTGDKNEIINAINNITSYKGINEKTGLNYAKDSFTGKAGNKHIIVFTDTESTKEATTAINNIQNDTSLYLTAVIMGENATKQVEYKQVTRTKVYMIDNIDSYNFETLYTNISNWVNSKIAKEMNDLLIKWDFTDDVKNLFNVSKGSEPSTGNLVAINNGYKISIPKITSNKISFTLKMTLKESIDRSYIGQIANIVKETTIDYKNNRQEPVETFKNTTVTPSISLAEEYSLEIQTFNKEFQTINVSGVKCKIQQKMLDGTLITDFDDKTFITDSNGKILIDTLTYVGDSVFELSFVSTPGAYELKTPERIQINKNAVTGALTVTDTTLSHSEGEDWSTNNQTKTVFAKVAISPKAIIFNVNKTDVETGEPISGVQFELTQPQTENIPSGSVIKGTTKSNGKVPLSAEVAGTIQTYIDNQGKEKKYYYPYQLKEIVPVGYIGDEISMTLYVHFDLNGEITDAYRYIDPEHKIPLPVNNDVIDVDLTNKKMFYTLVINAIDAEYNKIPVVGALFKVTGIRENGSTIVPSKVGTTNANGKMLFEVNYSGKVQYVIEQVGEHAAYENASNVQYYLTRDFETNALTLDYDGSDVEVDDDNKIVTVTIPMTPKKFEFQVDKIDLDENIPVEGVTLKLTQPTSNGIGRKEQSDTTLSDGIVKFEANVVCGATGGTSTYHITETQKALGYKEIKGSLPVDITFDEHGNVTGITSTSSYIKNMKHENKKVEMELVNEQQEYTVEVYAKHKLYNEIPVKDVNLNVIGNVVDDGNVIGTQFYDSDSIITDEFGKAGTGAIKKSGDMYYTVVTNSVPKGYKLPSNVIVKVNKNLATENLKSLSDDNTNSTAQIDNTNKIIKITLYIEPELVTVKIKKQDIGTTEALIGNAKFVIIQPEISYEFSSGNKISKVRNVITGVTKKDEILELKIENPVIQDTTERTFKYTVNEIEVPYGYVDTKLHLKFDLTFDDDGNLLNITNIEETSNSIEKGETNDSKDDITSEQENYLRESKIENNELILAIGNKQKAAILNVLALNGKYKSFQIPVDGITINTKILDKNGSEIYNKDLVTDEDGKIQIAGISQTEDFVIKLKVTKGNAIYLEGAEKTIYLNRDLDTTNISLKQPDGDTSITNSPNKIIDTKIYVDVRTFDLDISKFEELSGDTLIGDAKFSVTQPKIRGRDRDIVQGKTVKNEKLFLKLEVAGEGEQVYTLKEIVPDGYIDNKLDLKIKVIFDSEGNIQNLALDPSNDDNIKLDGKTNTSVSLSITNEQKPYKFVIKTVDDKYTYDENIVAVSDVDLTITGTASDWNYTENGKTSDGGIYTSSYLEQRGDVEYLIHQNITPAGYEKGDDILIKINKDWFTTEIIKKEVITNAKANVSIDNSNKIIYVNIRMIPRTFNVRINKVDKEDNSIKVPGATFMLKQPKFSFGRERTASKATTDAVNDIILSGEVAGEGEYTYTLIESVTPSGYNALAPSTNLIIEFDENGKVINVKAEKENEFVKIYEIEDEKIIPMQIANEKKVHSLMIFAESEELSTAKVEGLHIRLVGYDSNNNQIPIALDDNGNLLTELTGVTSSEGMIRFKNLIGPGDIRYRIIQEEPRPAAFYLGPDTYGNIHIDEVTNNITSNDLELDGRQINVYLKLEPKKFTISLSIADYDEDNLIGGARITYHEAKWGRNRRGYTADDEEYIINGYVPGEGKYQYIVSEGYFNLSSEYYSFYGPTFMATREATQWNGYPTDDRDIASPGYGIPVGYQNYLNSHKINIEFDDQGDIIGAEIDESYWYKIFYDDKQHKGNMTQYKDLPYHSATLNQNTITVDNIDVKITNVKKQFYYKMNVYNEKYNEKLSNIHFKITATDSAGNVLFDDILETDNGIITIKDVDHFRVTGNIVFTLEALDVPSMLKDFPKSKVVINRANHPNQLIAVDYFNTSEYLHLTKAKPIIDIYNTNDFTYYVNVPVPLFQKTFELDLTKVNVFNQNMLLKGASFELTQPDGKHFETETTDENGFTKFSADLYGENTEYMYLLKETESPTGYMELTEPIKVYVTAEDEDIKSIRYEDDNICVREANVENSKKANIIIDNIPNTDSYNVELIEKCSGKPIKDSKYNIYITATTGEELNVTDYTDAKGKIEIKRIPGQGKIEIKINELQNGPGASLIEGEKIAVVDRSSSDMTVVESETSSDIKVKIDSKTNTVVIEIESIPSININQIEFKTVDEDDKTVFVGGVDLSVLQPNAPNTTNITTNSLGYASITNPNVPGIGDYEYTISVTNVPESYFDFLGDISVIINYTDEGNIGNIQKIQSMAETEDDEKFEVNYDVDVTETTTTYKAIVTIKLKSKDKYKLQVTLNETGHPEKLIKGSNFEAKSVVNSYTASTSKTTDENGQFSTFLAGGEEVVIYLTQKTTAAPYVLDDETKVAVLQRDEQNNYQMVEDESTPGLEVTIGDDGIVDINVENDPKAANINFQILKVDSENEALRLEGVKLKLLDKFNNKEYEIETDESGQVLLDGFKVTEPGEYDFVLTEISTIEGYDLPEIPEGEEIVFKIIYDLVDDHLQIRDVIQQGGEEIITGLSYTQTVALKEYILQLKLIIENDLDEEYKYNININKRDKDTLDLLSGAKIKIRNTYPNGNSVSGILETDENGNININIPLVYGDNTITIEEIQAPEGYILDCNIKKIILNKNKATGKVTLCGFENITSDCFKFDNKGLNIYFDNKNSLLPDEPSYGIMLTKIDYDDNSIVVGDAKYSIKVESTDGNYIKEFNDIITALNNGMAYVGDLKASGEVKITIKEIQSPVGYVLDKEEKIILLTRDADTNKIDIIDVQGTNIDAYVEGSTIKVNVKDERLKIHTTIFKKNSNTEEPISNIKFTIAEVIDDVVSSNKAQIVTDEEGKIDLNILVATPGEHIYEIEEMVTVEYLPISPIRVKVNVNEEGVIEKVELLEENENVKIQLLENTILMEIKNIPYSKYKKIEIIKVDANNEEIKLEGAKFDVAGIICVTDINGYTYRTIGIPGQDTSQVYTIKELEAPFKYILNEELINLKLDFDDVGDISNAELLSGDTFAEIISYNKNSATIKVKNIKEKAYADSVIVKKYIKDTEIGIKGAKIALCDEEGNILTTTEGNQIILETDENGNIDFATAVKLYEGTYYYKEVEAPIGYILNDKIYSFTVDEEGNVIFNDESNGVIYNEKIRVIIRKCRKGTDIGLAGAKIELFDKQGLSVILETDENGYADFTNTVDFEIGKLYYYREIQAPDGYDLNDNIYSFIINDNYMVHFNESNNGVIYNDRLAAHDIIIKKYILGTEIGLKGAKIALYDNNGNIVLNAEGQEVILETDEDGKVNFGAEVNLAPGTYYYKEIKAPNGYVLNNIKYSFNIDEAGNVHFNEDNNGIIYNEKIQLIIRKCIINTDIGLAGAHIALYDGNGKLLVNGKGQDAILITDENGNANFGAFIDLKPGTYYYRELVAPNGYTLNKNIYSFTISEEGYVTFNEENQGVIYNERIGVIIRKYRTGTDMVLSGAKIGLFDNKGNFMTNENGENIVLETNENGEVDFGSVVDFVPGKYYYKEIEAPRGYVLNKKTYSFTIDEEGNVIFNENNNGIIYNDRIKANKIIIKKCISGTHIGLAGARIELYDSTGNIIVNSNGQKAILETDENGVVDFGTIIQLEPGKYYYRETKAPEGYTLNTNIYSFIIDEDGIIHFGEDNNGIIYNERIGLIIRKCRYGTDIGLAGAKIAVYDVNGEILKTINGEDAILITDENGYANFGAIINFVPGTYYYRELEAPEGYDLNDTIYSFTISEEGIVTFNEDNKGVIYNKRLGLGTQHIIIRKCIKGTTIGLPGAKIALYNESGEPVINIDGENVVLITDNNGYVDFGYEVKLEPGTYYYREIVAPAGYTLNKNIYSFTIDEEGNVTFNEDNEGIIYNERITLILRKCIKGTYIGLAGAHIALYDENGKLLVNGKGQDAILITDENGNADFGSFIDLVPGTYYYRELVAPNGYTLNKTIYSLTIDEEGNVIFNEDNQGIIYNERIRLLIRKCELGTEIGLAGAHIALYDADGNIIVNEEGQQAILVTDENGYVDFGTFIDLVPGTYYYREIIAPKGYTLNRNIYSLTIDEEGNVIFNEENNGVIYNERIRLIIRKYIDGTEIGLSGAHIALYDSNGNIVINNKGQQAVIETNENGEANFETFIELEPGTYYYKEIKAPNGYKLNVTIYSLTIDEEGNITFNEDNEGIIYNERIGLILRKCIKGTHIGLAGAHIALYDTNGKETVLITDANGYADFGSIIDLLPGTYYYKEIIAPNGYTLNKTVYSFTIDEEGNVTFNEDNEGIIYNERIGLILRKCIKGTHIGLAGAHIALYDPNGKETVLITDANGYADFGSIIDLVPGTYYYKEIIAPNGYTLNKTVYSFTIDEEGNITFNEDNEGIIYNEKIMEEPEEPEGPEEPEEPEKSETPEEPTNSIIKDILPDISIPYAGRSAVLIEVGLICIGGCIYAIAKYIRIKNKEE